MGEFLLSRGLAKGSEVENFVFENVAFPWKATHGHGQDCGVFVMIHQLLYCGNLFDCDLGCEDSRCLYRGEVTATLVLSDMNMLKPKVLESLNNFRSFKNDLKAGKGVKRKTVRKIVGKNKKTKSSPINPDINSTCDGTPITYNKTPSPTSFTLNLAPSSIVTRTVLGSRSRGKGDGLGCTLNLSPTNSKTLLLSKYLRGYVSNIQNMKLFRKNVADYAYLDDHTFDPA